MGILSGIVSYIFGLVLNLLDTATNGFLGALGFDLDTFEKYFPAAKDYHDIIIGFAVGLLFIMLIFQIFRNFGIMLDMEAEDPLKMLGKTMLFFGMIMYSRSITNTVIQLLVDPYAIFINAASDPYEFELLTLVTSMFTSVFSNPFMAVVALILMLVLGWQFLKLTIECVERYIVFYFIIYCAPVVFATGAFKSTAQIFKSWCRMLASQALLLLLNIWSIKLFLSYLPVLESDMSHIIFNFLIGYAFLKFAQKADTLLRILGLNTASTGDMMRSLGGTLASIAFAVRTFGGMANSVMSAAGRIFGGGAAAAAGAAGAGAGAAAGNAGNAVSGMMGGVGSAFQGGSAPAGGASAGGGESDSGGGVTNTGISSAKQKYTDDVLGSAKSQLSPSGQIASGTLGGGGITRGGGAGREHVGGFGSEGTGIDLQDGRDARQGGGGRSTDMSGESAASLEKSGLKSDTGTKPQVDAETKEGLSNLARGLPHERYDPITRTFYGGGFSQFSGENANIIGASELAPSNGFEQSSIKMKDGSAGTVYQNKETGEAHLVQFGSVDNGVIQGTISGINSETGQIGEGMSFKAVHGSVPRAESYSRNSIPISDGDGGAYHISTGASTSFFAPGGTSAMPGITGAAAHTGSSFSANQPNTAGSVSAPAPSSSPSPAPASVLSEETAVHHASTSAHDTSSIHNSSIGQAGSDVPPVASKNALNDLDAILGGHSAPAPAPSSAPAGSTSIFNESQHTSVNSGESPPVSSGMKEKAEDARRFSKNNPANLEIFRRGSGNVESFDRSGANLDSIPKMNPPGDQ